MSLFTKPLYFLLISIAAVAAISFFVLFQQYDKIPLQDASNMKIGNYFSDNITRTATMYISNSNTQGVLSVNVIQDLTITGKIDAIRVWPLRTTWGNPVPFDFSLEDENHEQVYPTSLNGHSDGYFFQEIAMPECTTLQEDLVGDVELIDGVIIPIQNSTHNKAFAKYPLPDLLSQNGRYNVKFISPYTVRINVPDGATIISNHTTTCVATLDPYKRQAFSYDIVFDLK